MTSSKRTVEFFWIAVEMALVIAIASTVILVSFYVGKLSNQCIEYVPQPVTPTH